MCERKKVLNYFKKMLDCKHRQEITTKLAKCESNCKVKASQHSYVLKQYCSHQSLMSTRCQFAVASRDQTDQGKHAGAGAQIWQAFARQSREEMKRLRNQSTNEARHSLLAQSISPLRRGTRASNDLPASLLRPGMEVDTGNNTHLASSLSDKQRCRAAADLPLKKNSLSRWGKWKITRLSPVDSFQFHLSANLILCAHIKPVYETKSSGKSKKKKKDIENGGEAAEQTGKCAGGKREELGGLAALDTRRLWLDIWSQSRWNVRRVMTGMVIGRLWVTPDPKVPKGHSSLNRLWADALSDHGKR